MGDVLRFDTTVNGSPRYIMLATSAKLKFVAGRLAANINPKMITPVRTLARTHERAMPTFRYKYGVILKLKIEMK